MRSSPSFRSVFNSSISWIICVHMGSSHKPSETQPTQPISESKPTMGSAVPCLGNQIHLRCRTQRRLKRGWRRRSDDWLWNFLCGSASTCQAGIPELPPLSFKKTGKSVAFITCRTAVISQDTIEKQQEEASPQLPPCANGEKSSTLLGRGN